MKRPLLWTLFALLVVTSFGLATTDILYWTLLGVFLRKRRV